MIKWDRVIPSATFLPSSFFPQLSRKGWPVVLIWALLDLKDPGPSAPVLNRRGRRDEGCKWSRKMLVLATAPQWTHHRCANRQEKCLLFPFFPDPALFHHSNGFKSQLVFRPKLGFWSSEVWMESIKLLLRLHTPSDWSQAGWPDFFPTFITFISNFYPLKVLAFLYITSICLNLIFVPLLMTYRGFFYICIYMLVHVFK